MRCKCSHFFLHYTLVLPVLFLPGGRLFFQSVLTNHVSLVVLFSRLPWFVLLHKPWQSGKQYYQTAMVCEVTQTMAVWETVLPNCHGL